jgi:hypothetical protein
MFGCSEETLVNSNLLAANNKLMKLPARQGLSVNSIFSNTKQISGSDGGSLTLLGSYSGGPYGTVTVNSTLTLPAGSFSGTKTITITAEDEYCESSFCPGMLFSQPGIYNITYTGVDLTGINLPNISFVYLNNNGDLEYAENDGIFVDFTTGKLQVINARIPHFSRYGFVN